MTFAAPLARWHMLAPSLCALGLLLAGQEDWLVAQSAGGVLTNAGQVHGVSAEGFSRQPAVKLRGVITFHEPESGITYVQDGTGGVAISAGVPSRLPTNVQSGVMVEIEGAAAPGLFAPAIAGADGGEPRVRVLGAAALPEPLTLAAEQLSRGAHDGSWIELRGIVRSLAVKELAPAADRPSGPAFGAPTGKATRISIELGTFAGRFTVIIPWQAGRPPPEHLVEARVRVRGVLGSIANRQRQWVGVLIFVPSLAEVQVERPPAPDPFGLPLQSVSEILRFSATQAEEERVRVRGQVTMVHPGFRLFLRSTSGAIEVQTPQPVGDLKPGAWLDVVGYPALLQARVCLQDAVFRSVSNGPPPVPLTLSRSETLARYADCELVKITGRLFQNTLRGTDRVLMIESDGQLVEVLFAATLSSEAARQVQRLRPGSELAITGIARVHGAVDWGGGVRPLSLSLLVRGVNDVTVLHEPGWWTTGRLLALVGVLGLVVALGAVWVAMLRRRVEQQTVIIRRNVQREAVWEERSRIAQDIHDDVGAALTQISLLGDLGRREGVEASQMQSQLGKVAEKSREAVRALDEIVWTVNPRNDTVARAASYLCQTVQDLLRDSPIRCRLQVPDELPELGLGARARHNLFLAVREAVNNVLKHSQATEARFTVDAGEGRFYVRLEDNGRGFDPAAANPARSGLANLRRRLADVGGSFELRSQPGQGTSVCFAVPATDGHTLIEGWRQDLA